ncbi:MAG: peptide ABC transporter permease [Desulfobacterium sp.]|nr:peptide ABC transporter permease [Desulfobacterium sp.]
MKNRIFIVGLIIILGFLAIAAIAPQIVPCDPEAQDLYHVLEGPSRQHLLGTDDVGRDLLSRVIMGTRPTLFIGVTATFLSSVIGVLMGLIAGYKGGFIDMFIMRLTDTFMCMPVLIVVLALVAVLGPGIKSVIMAITFINWTSFARIVRGEVLFARELPYVEAARAMGASGLRIIFFHLLPNVTAPVIVTASIAISGNIMLESAVSFLGLGAQPPTSTWGNELRIGYSYLEIAPLFSLVPGALITLSVLAFNFIGDGLRDTFDPRLSNTLLNKNVKKSEVK